MKKTAIILTALCSLAFWGVLAFAGAWDRDGWGGSGSNYDAGNVTITNGTAVLSRVTIGTLGTTTATAISATDTTLNVTGTGTIHVLSAPTGTITTLGSTTAVIGQATATGLTATTGKVTGTATIGSAVITAGTATSFTATTLHSSTGTIATLGTTTFTTGAANCTGVTATTANLTAATVGTLTAPFSVSITVDKPNIADAVEVGRAAWTVPAQYSGYVLAGAEAAVITPGTTGQMNVTVKHLVASASATAYTLTVPSGSYTATSTGAGTTGNRTLGIGDVLRFDVTQVCSGTTSYGLGLALYFTKP